MMQSSNEVQWIRVQPLDKQHKLSRKASDFGGQAGGWKVLLDGANSRWGSYH